MSELPTGTESLLAAVHAWRVEKTPVSAASLSLALMDTSIILESRATDFDVTVRRPCGLFRSIPEHLSADDSRIGEIFANIDVIKRGWSSWLRGFHRFAPDASFQSAKQFEESLDTHQYEELIHERGLIEQEGLELMNRTTQEIREIAKKIDLLREDRESVRDADDQIESFEQRRGILKAELAELDPAKQIKMRIVEYFEHMPERMRHVENAAERVYRDLKETAELIREVAPVVETDAEAVENCLGVLARLLTGKPSFQNV